MPSPWPLELFEIVTVHGDVERTDGHGMAPDGFQQSGEAPGQRNAALLDADERHFAARFMALRDFMSDPGQGAVDGGGIENDGRFRHKKTQTCTLHEGRTAYAVLFSSVLGHLTGWL